MRTREAISVGTQLDGRALPVSPRYSVKSRDIRIGCPGTSCVAGVMAERSGRPAPEAGVSSVVSSVAPIASRATL